MRINLEGGHSRGHIIDELLFRSETKTLACTRTLTEKSAPLPFLDPGGSARNVVLPAEADSAGLVFIIMNTADNAEIITVQDDTPTTVVTPTQNECAIVFCDGTTWRGFFAVEA